ncbi:hypothetical protein HOO68_03640 [Candidatus Gracilibacteria bacterium]|nr:hypothetical protein [Candidatus Gracilibacteria bacterium]
MENTFHHESEGTVESGVTSEKVAKSDTLVGRSRNLLLAIIAATGTTACVPYVYVQPSRGYYPERSNYYYDNDYYRSSAPTHEIKLFPRPHIERIDNGNNRGGHHNHQGGNHRGNHRR